MGKRLHPGQILNRVTPGRWEVDGSGLLVERAPGKKEWRVGAGRAVNGWDYLVRHGFYSRSFSSRARAVDALRLQLGLEPLPIQEIGVHWERQGEGVYHSSDGHWQLQQEEGSSRLLPSSAQARELLVESELSRQLTQMKRQTLRVCALRAELLSAHIGLRAGRED